MRCDFYQPLTIDFDDVAHEFLGGEHQLVVYHALRLRLEQHGARMDLHSLGVFGGLVGTTFLKASTMVEETGGYALSYVGVLVVGVHRQLLLFRVDLYSLHQSLQLFFDVSGSTKRSNLDVVVGTPLAAVLALLPLVVDVEEGQVVTPRLEEGLSSCVSMHQLILRTVEYSVSDGQHAADGDDLIDALVLLRLD